MVKGLDLAYKLDGKEITSTVNVNSTNQKSLPYVNIHVNKKNWVALVDTGAAVSLVKEEVISKIPSNYMREKNSD